MGLCHTVICFLLASVTVFVNVALHPSSSTSSIDHLVMREFVSGLPKYHLAIKQILYVSSALPHTHTQLFM